MEKSTYCEQTLPFWKKISDQEKKRLLDSTVENSFQAGETMHAGAEDCSGLFLIKKGQVRVFIISESGKEVTLYRLLERDLCIFSASCMLKNISFDVFVEAEKDTDCYLIPTGVYNQLQNESLPISEFTNALLASRFSDVMWIMEQILFLSFDRRLAIFLLEQSTIEGSASFKMTKEMIARHMGSAREVVSRMLKYFVEEGMVKTERGSITILDKKKLQKIAQ